VLLLDATIDRRTPHDDDDDDDDDCIDDDDQDVVSATTAASSATTAVVTSRSGRIDISTCAKTRVVVGDWGGGGWLDSVAFKYDCSVGLRSEAGCTDEYYAWFEFSEFLFVSLVGNGICSYVERGGVQTVVFVSSAKSLFARGAGGLVAKRMLLTIIQDETARSSSQ
jgi:hypothetical protein